MSYELLLPVVLGISLAAATGFRVFLPILITGFAMREGWVPHGDAFAWASTTPALLMFSVAALAEIAAYYIPGIDNLLDTIATPAATLAGIGIAAAMMTDLPPMLKWTLAIIAGGGAATMTQTTTAFLRGHSTILTAGLGNHLLATLEIIGALVIPVLAIAFPVLALIAVIAILWLIWRVARRIRAGRASDVNDGRT